MRVERLPDNRCMAWCRAAFEGDGDLAVGLLLGLTDDQKCRLDPQGNTVCAQFTAYHKTVAVQSYMSICHHRS